MSRYSIIIDEKLKAERAKLKEERAKEENYCSFENITDMCNYMLKINNMWVPTHLDSLNMCYREFGGVKLVRISTENYHKQKCFLSTYLNREFEANGVIVFK